MNYTRLISGLLGLPLVVLVLVIANVYIVDIAFAIIAIMTLHEYFNAFKGKANPIRWVGYIAAICIAFIHLVPTAMIPRLLAIIIPVIILLLFCQVIWSNLKRNIVDIAITFLGIGYIALFLMFIPIIHGMENGKILVWYVLLIAWGTDTFAYIVGRKFGKHKYSQISPNKSIEGCIGGTIAAIIIAIGYTLIVNTYFSSDFSYIYIGIMSFLLSVMGQIGDLAASSIKRYTQIKDFSHLIPGHGGMLDRIDSVIFVAPFAYLFFMLI